MSATWQTGEFEQLLKDQDATWARLCAGDAARQAFYNSDVWTGLVDTWHRTPNRHAPSVRAIDYVLSVMHDSVYPAARAAGMPEASFVFSDAAATPLPAFVGADSGRADIAGLKALARAALEQIRIAHGKAALDWDSPMSIEAGWDGSLTPSAFAFGAMTREYNRIDANIERGKTAYALIMAPSGGIIYEREGQAPAGNDEMIGHHGGGHHGGRGRGRGRGRRFYGGGWGGDYGYGDWYGDPLIVYATDGVPMYNPHEAIMYPMQIGRGGGGGSGGGGGARGNARRLDGYDARSSFLQSDDDGSGGQTELVGSRRGVGRGAGRFSGTLADLFPVLAPGARGMSADMNLGNDGILRVTACIDGRCYKREIDMGAVCDAIVNRVVQGHAALHRLEAQAQAQIEVAQKKDAAVQAAGAALIGACFDEHELVVCGGWWHSLTHGISHAASQVGTGIAHTLKALKAPISVAAAAAAVAFVGPQAGPIAGQLTGSLIDAANGDASAQQVVQQATAAAQSNPQIAEALGGAQKAVAQATAGYHAIQTAAQAANGDPNALKQVKELATAAGAGDSAAQHVMSIVAAADSVAQGNGSDGVAAADPALAASVSDDGSATSVSGVPMILPFLALAAAGGGGYWYWHREREKKRLAELNAVAAREIARMAAIQAAIAAAATPATAPSPAAVASGWRY